jgi:hypothetical protein
VIQYPRPWTPSLAIVAARGGRGVHRLSRTISVTRSSGHQRVIEYNAGFFSSLDLPLSGATCWDEAWCASTRTSALPEPMKLNIRLTNKPHDSHHFELFLKCVIPVTPAFSTSNSNTWLQWADPCHPTARYEPPYRKPEALFLGPEWHDEADDLKTPRFANPTYPPTHNHSARPAIMPRRHIVRRRTYPGLPPAICASNAHRIFIYFFRYSPRRGRVGVGVRHITQV